MMVGVQPKKNSEEPKEEETEEGETPKEPETKKPKAEAVEKAAVVAGGPGAWAAEFLEKREERKRLEAETASAESQRRAASEQEKAAREQEKQTKAGFKDRFGSVMDRAKPGLRALMIPVAFGAGVFAFLARGVTDEKIVIRWFFLSWILFLAALYFLPPLAGLALPFVIVFTVLMLVGIFQKFPVDVQVIVLVVIVGIGLLLTPFGGRFYRGIYDSLPGATAYEKIQLAGNRATATIAGAFERIQKQFQQQVGIATGDEQFRGEVDRARSRGLEVQFARVGTAEQLREYFLPNPQVILTGSISGRRLDPEICKLIGEECTTDDTIQVKCSTNKGEVATVTPTTITFKQVEDAGIGFACDFAITESRKSQRTITAQAKYTFTTAAYNKIDFITREKFVELELQKYRFPTYTPKFTPGPVSIKFSEDLKSPLIVGEGGIPYISASFQIENTGRGVIDEFASAAYTLPEGITINSCNPPLECAGNKCTAGEDFVNRFKNIHTGGKVTVTCLAQPTAGVLNPNFDITTDSFNVLTEYKYTNRDTISIDLIEPKLLEEVTCKELCDSPVGCSCPENCPGGTGGIVKQGITCEGITSSTISGLCTGRKTETDCRTAEDSANQELQQNCIWLKSCVLNTKANTESYCNSFRTETECPSTYCAYDTTERKCYRTITT